LKENKTIQPEELLKDLAKEFLDPSAGKTTTPGAPTIPKNPNQNPTNSPFLNKGPAKVNI